MVMVAAFGALVVLLDVKVTYHITENTVIAVGGTFSNDLKGAVISAILISGWTAVKEYWLGASASSEGHQATISKIAENGHGAKKPETPEEGKT